MPLRRNCLNCRHGEYNPIGINFICKRVRKCFLDNSEEGKIPPTLWEAKVEDIMSKVLEEL